MTDNSIQFLCVISKVKSHRVGTQLNNALAKVIFKFPKFLKNTVISTPQNCHYTITHK